MDKPYCKYDRDCYRKNPKHFQEFRHSELDEQRKRLKTSKTIDEIIKDYNGFFITKINNVSSGLCHSISLKEILNGSDELIESIHFNFMFDLDWLIQQYPTSQQDKPIYIVFGTNNGDYRQEASRYKQLNLLPVELTIPYGTHHTKMMILHYKSGIRIIIHTANLIPDDWAQKTQGVWLSPILVPLDSKPDICDTNFKNDLIEYLAKYRKLNKWINLIKQFDFSPINVFLVASVPGYHKGEERSSFGHMKLRKVLKNPKFGLDKSSLNCPVVCQFSSIGSLGSKPETWLTSQFLSSLSSSIEIEINKPDLKCIFPTVDNVRLSFEGYLAGISFPYQSKIANKQPYLNHFLHRWKANVSNRCSAMPHMKSYCRLSSDCKQMQWFLLTSANLSKAAWGELQVKGSKLFIKSYELGVLFLPKSIINKPNFEIKTKFEDDPETFAVPFDLPLVPYNTNDKPWIYDLCYLDPDSKGNVWVPDSE